MYVDIDSFSEAFVKVVPDQEQAVKTVLDRRKEGDSPLYRAESRWQGWPKDMEKIDVVNWFAPQIDQLLNFVEEHLLGPRSRRRLLAQPHRSFQGFTADCKLNVGFVDDSNVGMDSKCHWSQILIPTKLEWNPSADIVFKA